MTSGDQTLAGLRSGDEEQLPSSDAQQDSMTATRAYLRIFSYLGPVEIILESVAIAGAFGSGVALALVNLVIGRLITILTTFMTGNSTSDDFLDKVSQHCLYFVYIGIVRWTCTYLYTVLSTYSAYYVVQNIRRDFLRVALSQPIAFFDQKQHTSSISIQATSNGNLIQSGIAEKLMICFQALATLVTAFAVAFISQWKLTLILVWVAPTLVLIMGICAALEAKLETRMLDIFSEAGAYAESILTMIKTVHAFSIRSDLMNRYRGYLDSAKETGRKKSPLYGILFGLEYGIMYSAIGLAFWQGSKMVANREVDDLGTIFTVIMSVIVATSTFTVTGAYMIFFQRAATASAQLFALIDQESNLDPFDQSGEKPASSRGEIVIENVSFSYPSRPGAMALDGISMRVPAGKVTALVGRSGSGKSTLIGLIERWYNPDSGTISLDGMPIERLNLNWLRTHIRLVQQEPVLFNGTVFDNIAYGLVEDSPGSSSIAEKKTLVKQAAKLAFAHNFITMLPNGYATRIGERGSLLSGGQKQRIAIARSIISKPRILLLDEVTSALDPHAETIVQKTLDNISRSLGVTVVVIAHKISTVRHADNIFVMSKGRVVENGTDESLIALNGIYARMVQVQNLAVDTKRCSGSQITTNNQSSDEKTANGGDLSLRETKAAYNNRATTADDYSFANIKQIGLLSAVWKLLRENSELNRYFLMILVGCIFGSGVLPGQALLMAHVMDIFGLDPDQMKERGSFYSLMFFILGLGALVNYFILGWISNIAAQDMNKRFRSNLLDHVLRQDIPFFDLPENMVGALTSRVDLAAQDIIELMSINIILVLVTVMTVLACSILSIAIHWKLGLVGVFGGLSPLLIAGYTRIRLQTQLDRGNELRFAESAAIASESILAIRTVSSLAIENLVLQRYTDTLEQATRQSIIPVLHAMFWFSFAQSIEYFVLGLGFYWGCILINNGEMSLYQFFVSFMGLFFAGQNASTLFTYTSSITKGKRAANLYLWMRSLQPASQRRPKNKSMGPLGKLDHLQLDQVSFQYPLRPDVRVLENIDINIKPGQFVALVGPSGCGKSTVISLLERFYDPTSGAIYVNREQKLIDIDPDTYRGHVALVQQEPSLFSGTIRENVLLGLSSSRGAMETDREDELVGEALRMANAWEFVSSLPEGTGTFCGIGGLQLSGGQRQRIAIARALIRMPGLLLLDEATSALDTESEKVVQGALTSVLPSDDRPRITVAVAHRLSTIKEADRIFVFGDGRVVEQGSHEQLLALGGVYSKLCEAQSLDSI